MLSVEASATTATLQYTYDSFGISRTNRLDLTHYTLQISTSLFESSTIEVPLFADYPLGLPGPNCIADGSELQLLEVHLSKAIALYRVFQVWRRIGIARISDTLVNTYHVDWMTLSSVQQFDIR